MRFAMITSGGSFGRRLALDLAAQGVDLSAIVQVTPKASRANNRGLLRGPYRALRKAAAKSLKLSATAPGAPLEDFCRKLHRIEDVNGPIMHAFFKDFGADHILLGGSGILDGSTIDAAGCPVWNAHPALLPFVRGMDVVANAVGRGVAVGGTVHCVDQGIDTGAYANRWLVPVLDYDTLDDLNTKANVLCTRKLAEFAFALSCGEKPPLHTEQRRSPCCKRLTAEERCPIAASVEEGWAHELYQTWRSAAGDNDIPSDWNDHPAVDITWKE
mgnify:CR=1 FL=1